MNWHTLLAIDFDKWAAATYRANFPETRVECGPVSDLIDRLVEADVVLGGPPCQPHSHAGKRQASKDTRDCGPDFVAAIGKVRPRAFLMENVPGLLTSEDGRYFQRMYAAMEAQGYVVQYRTQDAVNFGVPQFRERLWVWGIRRDLYVDGIRHCWPMHTHAWPPPETNVLFGTPLLPGVTVGEALGLDGWIKQRMGAGFIERGGERRMVPTCEPAPTVGDWRSRKHFVRRVIGGGTNPHFAGEARTERDITDEPSTTIPAHHTHNAVPGVVEYRWSDAMLQKHPPASPASPAPTILGKFYKGGAEGLLEIDAPSHTIGAGSREPIQNWKGKGYVRRLTPLECMRLQSAPNDFRWPEKISKTAMYKICGNGWSCAHAAAFSAAFAKADPDSRTVIDLFCGGGLGACGWHQRFWSYVPREAGVA